MRADVVVLLADVISEAAERHELCDDHHSLCHADRQDPDAVLVVHRRHDPRLLQQLVVLSRQNFAVQHFDGDRDFYRLVLRNPPTLTSHRLLLLELHHLTVEKTIRYFLFITS